MFIDDISAYSDEHLMSVIITLIINTLMFKHIKSLDDRTQYCAGAFSCWKHHRQQGYQILAFWKPTPTKLVDYVSGVSQVYLLIAGLACDNYEKVRTTVSQSLRGAEKP